jgi:integrase
VSDAVQQFLDRHAKKKYRPKTLYGVTRYLNTLDRWGGSRKLDAVARADIRSLLDGIDAPVAANRTHAVLKTFFNWCVENDLIAHSPVTGMRAPHRETPRDRVLTDDELRAVWLAAEKEGFPLGTIIQLLILTGQRRGEVTGMRWFELDLSGAGLWTLPRERTKNDRRHEVPLSKQATAILNAVPRIGDCEFVFTLNGISPSNNFKAVPRLDVGIAPWTLHDLRRTAASGMAKLGVSLAVIEKVLNHKGGSFGGIVGVYQRHEFAEEKREALQRWADYVEQLVSAPSRESPPR